jgi:hypothetical protein
MLAFMLLPATSGDSRCSALVPLTNTVLLLGAPMLPTWWGVKISTYLHLELFLLIPFMLVIVDRIYYYCYNAKISPAVVVICIIIIIILVSLLI